MKVLIVGYGNMGQTYTQSFIASRFIEPKNIYVLLKSNAEVKPEFPINVITEPSNLFLEMDIIILSVKPQDFKAVASSIKPFLQNNQLILSVMAGVTISSLKKELNCVKLIRSMPNLSTQIGQGMTVFTASNDVDRKELFIIQNLINTTGKSIYAENEELINAATAISGSGPAYVFYFMQSMIEAAVELGFTQSEAELMVNQTFLGSVSVQRTSNISNNDWIKRVSSRGGTTESAFEVFQQFDVKKCIADAIFAANKRAQELGE